MSDTTLTVTALIIVALVAIGTYVYMDLEYKKSTRLNDLTYYQRGRIIKALSAMSVAGFNWFSDFSLVSYQAHMNAIERGENPLLLYSEKIQQTVISYEESHLTDT